MEPGRDASSHPRRAPDPDDKVAAAECAGQFSTDYGLMFTAAVFVSVVPLLVLEV